LKATLHNLSDNLTLIGLAPPLRGYSNFIGVWLYHRHDEIYLVDVGPASTAENLLQALHDLQIEHLDYILLTHIHLDHAGAVGELAARFGSTPIVCHGSALTHLVDPTRLWEGSQKVLGTTAAGYGPIRPVAADRLIDAREFRSRAVEAIETPGHSAHHVSYLTPDYLFAGEAGGVRLAEFDYLRPATPPKFFLDVALESLNKLIKRKPARLCYGHFGLAENGREMLRRHHRQLRLWERIIRDVTKASGGEDRTAACLKALMLEDPLLGGFEMLPADIKERETFFLSNSIRGFLGYVDRPE
jgi:glyoxylase-like metal-dependent hydrolase (beta-lactamase superfamily II)